MKRFLIVCGGTGGHLAPGIAIAEKLEADGHECLLLISRKEVDSRLVSKYSSLNFVTIPGVALSFRPRALLAFVSGLVRGFFVSHRLLRKSKPDVVLGFGGFLSAAVVLLSVCHRIPVALHEANRQPGRAIQVLGRFAKRVYLPAGVSLHGISTGVVRRYGYPVRKEFRPLSKRAARKKLGIETEGLWLAVMGGSQGASSLNDWMMRNYESLLSKGLNVYCVCGLHKGADGVCEYRTSDGKVRYYRTVPFCDDVNLLLASADLAISRAGAGAIAELTRCRLPSILVPYPYAADNHQVENARFLEAQGGCLVVEEEYLDSLADEVAELVQNDWLLETMRSNLAKIDDYNRKEDMVCDLVGLAQLFPQSGKKKDAP